MTPVQPSGEADDLSSTRTLRLVLSYDGTDFFGWQIQPDRRTVQGEIEKALAAILNGPVRVIGAGRTDRGVHALGQVASFQTDNRIPADALNRALNSLLPADVRIETVQDAPPGFHARYSATSRTYRYHIARRPGPIVFRYAWVVPDAPLAEALEAASHPLLGPHFFDTFTSGEGLDADTSCTIHRVLWRERRNRLTFEIESDRFLYRMVRTLVGALIHLHHEGRLSDQVVSDLIDARMHETACVPAPPNGLFLVAVTYPPDEEIVSTRPSRNGLE